MHNWLDSKLIVNGCLRLLLGTSPEYEFNEFESKSGVSIERRLKFWFTFFTFLNDHIVIKNYQSLSVPA